MTRIIFVCHGNICRSPMAEYIMKDMIKKLGCQRNLKYAPQLPAPKKLAIQCIRLCESFWRSMESTALAKWRGSSQIAIMTDLIC